MVGFPFALGIVSIAGYGGFSRESQIPASVFSGVVLCVIAYKVTGFFSSRYYKGYGKLSPARRIEWNNRGISNAHAVLVAIMSLYLVVLSDLFREDSGDGLFVHRSSTLSNTILGISIGYFLTDLAMIFWLYPALGGFEYVLHHGLSMFSILLSLVSGQAQFYILMVLFTESTTPFVNLRWYLDIAGQKDTRLYVLNGIALFLGWLIARIVLFIYFFLHMAYHFNEVKAIFPMGFYSLLTVPPVLAVMNLFWFWKIAKGMIKTLSKAKAKKHCE